MKFLLKVLVILNLLYISITLKAQNTLPDNKVIAISELKNYLKDEVKTELNSNGDITEANLALYFRQKFSERFFYDFETFHKRFETYNTIYSNQQVHVSRANDHMQKFADSTPWVLPFSTLKGEPVNAYALRHLARQHKMLDVAYQYFYTNNDSTYIQYFVNQMQSLNVALEKGKYEKIEDGNGVYEVFRSGYRILNWLSIHNMFLGEKAYSDNDQLATLATLLQHGAHLYERNASFKSGNHQTRGMSALAMLSILLRDFEGTDLWYARAMDRLEEHLSKEINDDGFQFERSVHYHMSDIENYFYVYQLAQISNIKVNKVWEQKLESLFSTLVKIAYPDKSAPVLQDDTKNPWAEKNDICGAMTLGYLLFDNPEYGYFAAKKVESKMYWFLKSNQLEVLKSVKSKKPEYASLEFPETHYYIMREGWEANDKMMIISAGLDDKKPDHQHGDMLGVQAIANGQIILPNYQVRYSLPDYGFFKNSMVKNVALVDDELQGKEYTSNKGGSGFGKFKKLPEPKTITWKSNEDYDLFVGSHNGFKNIGVDYTRQVIYVKDEFWIVKDNFTSNNSHTYKQVWQGHYTHENGPNLIRATFADASGCDIFQLNKVSQFLSSGTRGKEWTVVANADENNFNFITLIYPYSGYNNRIPEGDENKTIREWRLNEVDYKVEGKGKQTLSKGHESFLFDVILISMGNFQLEFSDEADVFVKRDKDKIFVHSLDGANLDVKVSGSISNKLNGVEMGKDIQLKPGDIVEVEIK